MIAPSTGRDIDNFLRRVSLNPADYATIVFCSPFIDDAMVIRLCRLAVVADRLSCGFRIITSPDTAPRVLARLSGHPREGRRFVIARHHIHAKVYLAIGRSASRSEAIVTSANLTAAATNDNIEFGIRARASSQGGREVVSHVHDFIQQLVAA